MVLSMCVCVETFSIAKNFFSVLVIQYPNVVCYVRIYVTLSVGPSAHVSRVCGSCILHVPTHDEEIFAHCHNRLQSLN